MNDDNKKVNANTENTDETEMSLDELDAVAGGSMLKPCLLGGNNCYSSGYTNSDGERGICFGGGKCPNSGVNNTSPGKCLGIGI